MTRLLISLVLAAAPAALLAAPKTPSGPYLYAARTGRQMKVVVDVNVEKAANGAAGAPVFIFYAQPVDGHDLFADYFAFDCAKGTARLERQVGVSKYVEPLDLQPTGDRSYKVPAASLMSEVMAVACRGRGAIPRTWVPLAMNLRQISADYYRSYLGQTY
ncbi:MAG: hypothetical protein ACYC8V_00075 [Caulobacteraceae bacterium]